MKLVQRLFATILVLCMALSLCACSNAGEGEDSAKKNSDTQQTTTEKPTEEETTTEDDGKVLYSVMVQDTEGNPIAGAMVQLCKDACIPAATNEDGVAEFKLTEDDYKVSFLTLPAGYAYSGNETEFYFEDGSYEMTITLKAE